MLVHWIRKTQNGYSVKTPQEFLQNISERYFIQNWSYLNLCNFSKEVSQITDWQTHKNFRIIWYKCTNIPGMPPKNFRKISHPEVEISLYLSIFSKKVRQLTDWQTYKKFRIIWNLSRNILVMSPKNFRKISHLEPNILNSLVNWSQTDRHTDKCKSRADPTRGGSAKNTLKQYK